MLLLLFSACVADKEPPNEVLGFALISRTTGQNLVSQQGLYKPSEVKLFFYNSATDSLVSMENKRSAYEYKGVDSLTSFAITGYPTPSYYLIRLGSSAIDTLRFIPTWKKHDVVSWRVTYNDSVVVSVQGEALPYFVEIKK